MSETSRSKCFLAAIGDTLSPRAKGALVSGTIGFFGYAITEVSKGEFHANQSFPNMVAIGVTLLAVGVGAIGLPAILSMIEKVCPSDQAVAETDFRHVL